MLWWKAKLNAVTTKFAEPATPETELALRKCLQLHLLITLTRSWNDEMRDF